MLLRTTKVDSHFTVPSSDNVTFETCPLEQSLTIFVSIVSWIETIPFTNDNDAASASCVSYPGAFLRFSKVRQHQHEMGTWTGAQWSFKVWPKQGNRLLSAIVQIINYVVLNVLCEPGLYIYFCSHISTALCCIHSTLTYWEALFLEPFTLYYLDSTGVAHSRKLLVPSSMGSAMLDCTYGAWKI